MTDRVKTTAGPPPADDTRPEGKGPAAGSAADEFAHIPSPRTRHPVLAAAAAALAFFLVFHIRNEIRFALSATEPLDLGDARVTFAPAVRMSGLDNRYVRVRGTPDRESALELDTKGSWTFTQFFRILGTGDRLFLHRRESPLPAFRAEDDVFEGRLIRFGDLSFESAIRGYFSAHVTATHFFSTPELVQAIAARGGGPLSLVDRAGDRVSIAPGDGMALDLVRPDEVRVGLPRDRFPTEAAARAAVEANGGEVRSALGLVRAEPAPGAPASGPLAVAGGVAPVERWVFVARFAPDKRDAQLSALGELDRKVEIRDARERIRARLSDVTVADGGQTLVVAAEGAPPRRLPVAAIAAARTLSTVQIPDDAYLVIEADHPRDHLATVLMGIVLAMFGAVNVVGLLRELRR
jgi:hypothetical protein